MTMLVSAFGILGRFAGDLLTSALSWASSLLFGRVPRSHQTFLLLMMAGSFAWLLVGLALLLPGIGSWLLDSTPHPPFIDRTWLTAALIVAFVTLPPAVGLAGFLVPATGERATGLAAAREVLRGYLLAPVIAGILVFLAGVGVARKIRSARHGWAVVHVPIVVKPDGYDQLVADLHDAVASVDLPTTAADAPWVLTLPAWILSRVAGDNVRKLRPDRLVELAGPNLRIGVYPSDIAISGTAHDRTRARAAILSRLATTAAHLTTSAEAQAVEDRIEKVAAKGQTAARWRRRARMTRSPISTPCCSTSRSRPTSGTSCTGCGSRWSVTSSQGRRPAPHPLAVPPALAGRPHRWRRLRGRGARPPPGPRRAVSEARRDPRHFASR